MVSLGIILLIVGAICAIGCHFANVPIGMKIGLGVAILGGALIIIGYLLPLLGGLGDDVDEPDRVGMNTSMVLT